MMADKNNNIIYTNHALQAMMSNVENDLRKALPHFNANKLIGENIDVFHKNPAHQQKIIANIEENFSTQIEISGRFFKLNANPIFQDGSRIGTVLEWNDRTIEVNIEKEIDAVIEAAARGDFSKALSTEDKSGFFKLLSQGLNQLINNTRAALVDVSQVIENMAKGNLTTKVNTQYEGLFGELKDNINTTVDQMLSVVSQIFEAADATSTGASEIEFGMRDLSARTEQQAASLEETASSMNQMTATVQSSAENAKNADIMAKEAQFKAIEGGNVVKVAVDAMQSISEASTSIANIIGVIDEIAFQTNLLALNAAVEAARAGEQGRGFAVVAAEVRHLAQRSSNAAKEIKGLINDSVDKVGAGKDLVNRSGKTLTEIVSAVEKVVNTISGIASAAHEQSEGITQVNIAIGQMDDMTQQNSALVEEANAASENMASHARAMTEVISFFKVS